MGNIDFAASIKLALLRIVASGAVLWFFLLFSGDARVMGAGIVAAPLAVAIMVSIGFVCSVASRFGVPFIGLGSLIALAGVIGDPLLWLIGKKWPGMNPARNFGVLNRPVLIIDRRL